MVEVAADVYDDGGVGDGNLTQGDATIPAAARRNA